MESAARIESVQHEHNRTTNPLRILLLICIKDMKTRDKLFLHPWARDLRDMHRLPTRIVPEQVSEPVSPDKVTEELHNWYSQSESCGAILVSDLLVEGTEPTSYAKSLFEDFGNQLYATVAVMLRPQKVLDI